MPQISTQLDEVSNDFNRFFRDVKDRVLKTVIVSTGNQHDAEDCVAEAFRKALESWERLRHLDSPAAWVVRVATNIHTDRQRKHLVSMKHYRDLVKTEWVEPQYNPLDPMLVAAVNRLPERQRQVLAYRVLLELSPQETAKELSINVATVGVHLHRALQFLRQTMQQMNESKDL